MTLSGRRISRSLALVALFSAAGARAANAAIFSRPPDTDIAQAWLDLFFRGTKLPDVFSYSAPNLNLVATTLHQAFSAYSDAILVIAGLLLFYHLAILVLETAHYGVPFGRSSTQIWGPIRLVLAIGLLLPMNGALSAGQYIVAWMAEQGSALASHVWTMASLGMRDSFSGVSVPRGPNVAGFVTGGLEMEFCRALYQQNYRTLGDQASVRAAGSIIDIQKLPRSRYAEETWQYTNRFQATAPMCGAYRFASSHLLGNGQVLNSNMDRLTNDIAEFSREQTEQLIGELQPMVTDNLPLFLGQSSGPGPHDKILALIAAHQHAIDQHLHSLITGDPSVMQESMQASSDAGWITAGGFMMQLARLQEMYGTLASSTLPAVQAPIFSAASVLLPSLDGQIASDPVLSGLAPEEWGSLRTFEMRVIRQTQLAHDWLYNRQLLDVPMVLANPFDLRAQMNPAEDPEAISSLYAHVLTDAANTYGVWNPRSRAGSSMALNADEPLLALPSSLQNPITALAEFGRRQTALGHYLFGLAGPDVAPPGTLAYSLLLGTVGLLFMASGLLLMFVIPLLPFIRFFMGILAWLLAVFEALIAVPLVALAHVNVSGEGMSGGAGRQAYLLWLNVLIRPVLTLFGLLTGLLLLSFAVAFLGMVFYQLGGLAAPSDGEMFVTLNVALTFLYTILACVAANVSFKGVTLLPELVFKWLQGLSMPQRLEMAQQGGIQSGAAGSSNFSVSAHVTTNGLGSPASLVTRGYTKAAASAHGLKLALFPHYKDNEKYVPPQTKGAPVSTQKGESGTTKTSEGHSPFVKKAPGAVAGIQRPDKRPTAPEERVSQLNKKADASEGHKEQPMEDADDPSSTEVGQRRQAKSG